MPISPARVVAFDVLLRVHGGAFACDLLVAKSAALETRDAGLASEIVFGCLRRQMQLDYLIDRLAARGKSAHETQWQAKPPAPPSRLDPEVRIALRMGVYQLRQLDRVPPHAAVGESVELVKRAKKRSAAGLVNAVLRKVDRREVAWPDRATELSCPQWLLDRWDNAYGSETSDAIARAFLEPPESAVATTGRVQDVGSQSIVPLLELQAGQSFLDVCAAPGNKTAQALEYGVEAVACDLYPHRLRNVPANCRRVAADATLKLPFDAVFDRILVDAPCSGTGTLGRNPEIKWRLQPSDLLDLHTRQVRILSNALQLLERGGRLVYSTCSLEPEENEDVIAEATGDWKIMRRIPGLDRGDGFFVAVLG